MHVETLLPLGKVDPGLRAPETPFALERTADDARLVEMLGYDGFMVEDTKQDPFVVLALAAQATTRLRLGTAVAIAFPRSPTVMAMTAWTLARLAPGRFTLGLGSQVKGHIERRYGLRWSAPGPWMREYVQALRAVWACWQSGAPLDFRGEHYRLDLMNPLFTPAPLADPSIPVHLAAVNPYMCQVAGEVADGVRPHPVCTPGYIREVMLPALRQGAARAGRTLAGFQIAMKPLVATAPDRVSLAARITDVRARIAFYASTATYRRCFEAHGLGALAHELSQYSKAGRWEAMPARITDEVLDLYATVGTYDEIADKLVARYGALVTHIEFSIPITGDADRDTLRAMLARLRAAGPGPALD